MRWLVKNRVSIYQIDVSFLCVCPVIDNEIRHHIVKVAVDPRGDSRVDLQIRQQIVEFPALVRWRVARMKFISNSCVCPNIDHKINPMSAREFLQLS